MEVEGGRLAVAFGLTLFAGLATGVGSAIAFFARKSGARFLSVALGFSAGVMLYVSFVEILAKARTGMAGAYGARLGAWLTVVSFFAGLAVMGLIDALVPQPRNPHAARGPAELQALRSAGGGGAAAADPRLLRMGLFSALAIAIHNFPEGIATFFATLDDPRLGLAIATAVALHNIPEGVSVSVPIFYATQNRPLAFRLSLLSGLAEPVGAILAWLLLGPFITPGITGALFGAVAGVMVYIALDELAPTAREYGEGHVVIAGIVGGMLVMAVSLLLMAT